MSKNVDQRKWTPLGGLSRAIFYGFCAGLFMGLVYFVAMWFAESWIRTSAFRRLGSISTIWRGPGPFILLAGVFGWTTMRIVERTAGFYGNILLVPVVCSIAAAMLVAVGLGRATIDPWTDAFSWTVYTLGVGMFVSPAYTLLTERSTAD